MIAIKTHEPAIKVVQEQNRHDISIWEGNTRVASLSVFAFNQRIGDAVVPMGGIGGVNTDPEYRLHGYARTMLTYAVDWMTQHGYYISGLYGIPNFYTKFGFATCLAEYLLTIPLPSAERIKGSHPSRLMEPEDVPVLLDIYQNTLAQMPGTIQRSPENWKGFLKGPGWGKIPQVEVITDSGKPVGYMVFARYSDDLDVGEIAAVSWDGYCSLIARAAAIALQRRGNIIFHIPPSHPVTQIAKIVGCKLETTYPRDREGMWRILNLGPLFKALEPTLRRRWLQAGQPAFVLLIETDIGTITISAQSDLKVVTDDVPATDIVVRISQSTLMQLIMGYTPADAVANYHRWDEGTARILSILFPETDSYIYWPDRF